MRLLLDTCSLLWMADRVDLLSASARAALEDPDNELLVSQVSMLEIQIKHGLGKLPLGLPPEEFVTEACRRFGLACLPLADEHIWTLRRLPLLHRDPFDRLLLSQAVHEGLPVVTPDPLLHQYPVRLLW